MDLKKRRLEIDLHITCKKFVLPKPNPCVPIVQPSPKAELGSDFYIVLKRADTYSGTKEAKWN